MRLHPAALFVGLLSLPAAAQEQAEATRGAAAGTGSEAVVVRGQRPRTAASERRVTAAELSRIPARTAEDLLALVPGVQVAQHGSEGKGHQFFVRGFDAVHGADVRVTVEGIPINEPSNVHGHGYVDLGFVIPELVVAIDARKGAYALDQGDFGTAAALDLRLGAAPGTRVAYQAGLTNRHRGLVVHGGSDAASFIGLEGLHDDGYGENRQVRRGAALGRLEVWRGAGHRLVIRGGGAAARFGLPGALRREDAEREGFYGAYLDDTGGESDRVLLAIEHSVDHGDTRLRLQVFGHWRRLVLEENYTGNLGDPDRGDRRRQRQHGGDGGAALHLAHRLGTATLRLDTEWRIGRVDQREDQLDLEARRFATSRDLDALRQSGGLAAGAEWRALAWLRLEGGLRGDVFRYDGSDRLADAPFDGTVFAVSPRARAVALLGDEWSLFAAYGRGLRSPEARAFSGGGEPTVTTSDDAEVGARYEPSDDFAVGLAVFGVRIGREVIFDHVAGTNIEVGGTLRYGAELDLHLRPLSWLSLDADLTAVDARFVESDEPVPSAPRLLANAGFTLAHPAGWRASAHVLWVGPRPLPYGAKAGDLLEIDLSAGYRWRHLELRLDLENPLNQELAEIEAHYASHWNRDRPASRLPAIHTFAAPPLDARLTATAWF